jgi:hypothetical protein
VRPSAYREVGATRRRHASIYADGEALGVSTAKVDQGSPRVTVRRRCGARRSRNGRHLDGAG